MDNKHSQVGLEGLVKRVFEISKDIRFAAVFDSNGKRLAGGMREGTKSLDPPKTSSKIDRATAMYPALLAANERYMGKFEFMFTKMRKVNAIVVEVSQGVLLVVTTSPRTGIGIIPTINNAVRGP